MTAPKASYETHEIPERRIGDEDDIAGAILFLVSKAGSYCNGNVLVTDGGRLSVNPATYQLSGFQVWHGRMGVQ